MITDDTRLFVVNMRRVGLGPVVLAPDVEHEDAGDEEERHDEDWDRSHLDRELDPDQRSVTPHLDTGRVVSVEPPHPATAGPTGPHGGGLTPTSSSTSPLPHSSSSSSASPGAGSSSSSGRSCSH